MALGGLATMWSNRGTVAVGPEGQAAMTGSMLLLDNLGNVSFYLCLWPVVLGGTVAEDLATGFAALLLPRAGSRRTWLVSNVVAVFAASAGLLSVVGSIWVIGATMMAPWGASAAPIVVTMADGVAGEQPLGFAIAVLFVLAIAGTAVVTVSHVVGAFVRSPFASQVVAAVLYLLAALVLPPRFNPAAMASVFAIHAPWATPQAAITYWLSALGGSLLVTYLVLRAKEA